MLALGVACLCMAFLSRVSLGCAYLGGDYYNLILNFCGSVGLSGFVLLLINKLDFLIQLL